MTMQSTRKRSDKQRQRCVRALYASRSLCVLSRAETSAHPFSVSPQGAGPVSVAACCVDAGDMHFALTMLLGRLSRSVAVNVIRLISCREPVIPPTTHYRSNLFTPVYSRWLRRTRHLPASPIQPAFPLRESGTRCCVSDLERVHQTHLVACHA